jgi:hypothetical protein
VLEISSQNDTNDGIAFTTNASSQIRHNGHVMWDAGNDGASSGLDADLLDGQHASAFALSAHTHDDRYYTETETNNLLNAKLNTSARGAANGVASLDANSKIPIGFLPNEVFDSLSFSSTVDNGDNDLFANKLQTALNNLGIVVENQDTYRALRGKYFVASFSIEIQEEEGIQTTVLGDLYGGEAGYNYWAWTFATGDDYTPSRTSSGVLEAGDWIVIQEISGLGSSDNPYRVVFGVVNNTYELADETVHGIVKLSNTTTISSSTTGSEVITQGVLGGLIGTAANTIAAGDDARFTDARTPLSHAHGNITNAGAIGSTADLVAVTTTSGVLTTASRSGIDSRTAFPTTYANITGTVPTWNQSTTGNAATATALQNARTIGGVSFNGTANINLPGVNTAGTQNTSGNAATATNISNTGTVTLATATENNQITVTAPSYGTDLPVKLLNFHWYSNNFSIGNIRSAGTATNGLGFYYTPSGGSLTELLRINPTGNVGIGTTNPSSAIHIKKATPEIKLEAGSTTDSGTMRYNTTTKSIEFIFV